MEKPKILENRQLNKGLFRVILKFKEGKIVGYVDDDGYYDNLAKLDESGNEIKFDSVKEKTEFHHKYVQIFDEMESNYEIGFGGPVV